MSNGQLTSTARTSLCSPCQGARMFDQSNTIPLFPSHKRTVHHNLSSLFWVWIQVLLQHVPTHHVIDYLCKFGTCRCQRRTEITVGWRIKVQQGLSFHPSKRAKTTAYTLCLHPGSVSFPINGRQQAGPDHMTSAHAITCHADSNVTSRICSEIRHDSCLQSLSNCGNLQECV
jgi:hypothetical protein